MCKPRQLFHLQEKSKIASRVYTTSKQSDCKLTGQRKGFHDQLAQLEVRSYSSEAGSPQLCGLSPLQFIEIVKVVIIIMMVIIITYVRLGRVAHSHMSRTNKLVALYMSRF